MKLAEMRKKRYGMSAGHWLETARGRLLLQYERRQIRDIMPSVLGYRMLQIGHWGLKSDAAGGSAILQHWILDVAPRPDVGAVVEMDNLPVASHSVDAVLLPHSLELSVHPHRLLREVDRVLCQRGQIILLGFNPLNPATLLRRWPARQPLYPSLQRLYTVSRISDWLGLLDYEIEHVSYYGPGFPWLGTAAVMDNNNGRSGLLNSMEGWRRLFNGLSQAYLIFARKRVIPLTPTRPQWETAKHRLGPMALPEARVSRVIHLHGSQPSTKS